MAIVCSAVVMVFTRGMLITSTPCRVGRRRRCVHATPLELRPEEWATRQHGFGDTCLAAHHDRPVIALLQDANELRLAQALLDVHVRA